MTDNGSTNLSRNLCDDSYHKNSSVDQKISDPEILDAKTISLRDAQDAFYKPGDVKMGTFEETVEITPMDSGSEKTVEITPMDFGSVANKSKYSAEACWPDVSGAANNESTRCEKQEDEKPSKRIKVEISSPATPTTPVPLRKLPDCSRKVLDKNDNVDDYTDDIDESFSDDEVDNELPKGDTDYKPGSMKSVSRKQKAKNSIGSKSVSVVAMFDCGKCTFRSGTLGELKIHRFKNHESSEAPSYLDMAETALAQIDNGSGVEEVLILKEVLFEHFDAIVEEKAEAARILKQALRAGVRLGRLQVLRRKRGKESFNVFKIVNKNKMMLVIARWKDSQEVVEFKGDSTRSRKRTQKVGEKIKTIGGGRTTVKFVSKKISCTDNSEPAVSSKNKEMLMMLKQTPNPQYIEWKPQSFIPQSPYTLVSYEESDSLTCSVCMLSFWYERQTIEHMKLEHGEGNDKTVIHPPEGRDPIADQVEKDVGEKIICEVDLPMQLLNNETVVSSVVKDCEIEGVKRKSLAKK